MSQATQQKMWTAQTTRDGKTTGYGLGWGIGELKGHKEISHSGGQPGTSTKLTMLPDLNMAVVVMVNMEDSSATDLAEKILADLVP